MLQTKPSPVQVYRRNQKRAHTHTHFSTGHAFSPCCLRYGNDARRGQCMGPVCPSVTAAVSMHVFQQTQTYRTRFPTRLHRQQFVISGVNLAGCSLLSVACRKRNCVKCSKNNFCKRGLALLNVFFLFFSARILLDTQTTSRRAASSNFKSDSDRNRFVVEQSDAKSSRKTIFGAQLLVNKLNKKWSIILRS